MSELGDPGPGPELPPADRVFLVAAIAAAAAVVWCLLVMGAVGVPLALFAAPASALLWFVIANHLEDVADLRRRLWLALGIGAVSPIPGLVLAWLPSWCCFAPCLPTAAAVAMLAHLWTAPWLWLPVGAGMGLVAFVVVTVRRAPPT